MVNVCAMYGPSIVFYDSTTFKTPICSYIGANAIFIQN